MESNDSEEDEESRALINKCRRLLLDAGADPTLTVDSDASSFLVDIAAHGALVSLLGYEMGIHWCRAPGICYKISTNSRIGVISASLELRNGSLSRKR